MNKKYFVGIDAGRSTGWAIWDATDKKFVELCTLTFWETIKKINDMTYLCEANLDRYVIVIENPNLNKPTWGRKILRKGKWIDMPTPMHDRVSQNVGMNKRDAQLLIEYCKLHLIDCMEVNPRNSQTKLTANAFKNITGYDGSRCSQHARDAAMMVFGR